MAEIHGKFLYPGCKGFVGGTYTLSHGISPGTIVLRIPEQDVLPPVEGDVVITDDVLGKITVPGCRLCDIHVENSGRGRLWCITLNDRRWRWADQKGIDGWYNQLDPHGKLLPWTIMSPTELAKACLKEMGEKDYELKLPPGLDSKTGGKYTPMLSTGINYPATGTNPPISWLAKPPAQALQEVASTFGCRVIYRLATNSILVAPLGLGASLPVGSINRQSMGLTNLPLPDSICVVGSPTRYQVRLRLEAVGEEWDGSYRPINHLSYAPVRPAGRPQITSVRIRIGQEFAGAGVNFDLKINGEEFVYEAVGGETNTTILSELLTRITTPRLDLTVSGNALVMTGTRNGETFAVEAKLEGAAAVNGETIQAILVQSPVADEPGGYWGGSEPPLYSGVHATDRLTYDQALELARKSVFRCYRVVDESVEGWGDRDKPPTGKRRPINVPGYGDITTRHQLLLLDSKVDQVVPAPGDETIRRGFARDPLTMDYYNSYSKDQAPRVYGSIYNLLMGLQDLAYVGRSWNTNVRDVVMMDFGIDPEYQVITFSSPVYYNNLTAGTVEEPLLSLETAVQVRDFVTNQFECYRKFRHLPGSSTTNSTVYRQYPDVQMNHTSRYTQPSHVNDSPNTLLSDRKLEDDPDKRAKYYLDGMLKEYLVNATVAAQTISYNGIRAIDCDTGIQQVTWAVQEGSGCNTTVSQGTEHAVYVPPYPARRRSENLRAASDAVERNNRVSPVNPWGRT